MVGGENRPQGPDKAYLANQSNTANIKNLMNRTTYLKDEKPRIEHRNAISFWGQGQGDDPEDTLEQLERELVRE